MYPPTKKAPNGKLRLMYEANPMAFIIEQAGGKAIVAPERRVMEVQPNDIHQRTPLVIGSPDEVDHVAARIGAAS
jgi:fructose-1,6-bisphosphatase I